jgi:hypothetical protein
MTKHVRQGEPVGWAAELVRSEKLNPGIEVESDSGAKKKAGIPPSVSDETLLYDGDKDKLAAGFSLSTHFLAFLEIASTIASTSSQTGGGDAGGSPPRFGSNAYIGFPCGVFPFTKPLPGLQSLVSVT